jgi:hypothetical protein
MAPERRSPALHDGARRTADVGGQGVHLFIGRKRLLEDRVQGQHPPQPHPRVLREYLKQYGETWTTGYTRDNPAASG